MLILSFHSVNSFEVQTLNGELMEWNQSFCLDDPENYYDLVGDDYYLYCEGDFGDEYNAVDTAVLVVNESASNKNNISLEEKNNTNLDFQTEIVVISDEPRNEERNIPSNNWILFASIFGIILILIVVVLVIAHKLAILRDEKKQIISLSPYINNLRKRGYTENQLEDLLIKRGYDSAFINKLLNKK